MSYRQPSTCESSQSSESFPMSSPNLLIEATARSSNARRQALLLPRKLAPASFAFWRLEISCGGGARLASSHASSCLRRLRRIFHEALYRVGSLQWQLLLSTCNQRNHYASDARLSCEYSILLVPFVAAHVCCGISLSSGTSNYGARSTSEFLCNLANSTAQIITPVLEGPWCMKS